MRFYGVWDVTEDAFVAGPETEKDSAEWSMADLIQSGVDPRDLSVREMCPDHLDEEQLKDHCEYCF